MRARGFTLVEVLVALAIVAAGTAALLTALNSASRNTLFLREKSFAGWVAANRIAETRLLTAPPAAGTTTGESEMGGQRWLWRQTVSRAQIPGMLRVDVKVRPADAGAGGAPTPPATGGATGAADEGGDWTFEASGVIGLRIAPPTGTDPDWNPPPPSSNPPTPGSPGGGGAPAPAPPGGTPPPTPPGGTPPPGNRT